MDRTQGSPYLGHQTAISSSPSFSPDQVKYKLGSLLGPYSWSASGHATPTTSDKSANSVPISSYPSLNQQQIKKFHAAFTKTDAKVNNL